MRDDFDEQMEKMANRNGFYREQESKKVRYEKCELCGCEDSSVIEKNGWLCASCLRRRDLLGV